MKCKIFDNPYVAALIIISWAVGFVIGFALAKTF